MSCKEVMNWGTGSYEDVIVKDNFAFCAADFAGLDILDINNPLQPAPISNCHLQHRASALFGVENFIYVTGHNRENSNYSFTIIDISDKTQPLIRGSIDDFGYIREVVVTGAYAYIGTYGGLAIVDISDPTHPQKVGFCNLGIAPMWLAIRDGYAFMANIFKGFQVVDISDVSAPVLVATNDAVDRLNDIDLYGDLAFVSSETNGLGIFDISNPEEPRLLGEYNVDEGSNAIAVTENGNQVQLMDRGHTLYTFSVSDPANPKIINTFETAGTGTGIDFQGNLSLVTEGVNGLEIIDNAQPSAPQRVALYDVSGDLNSVTFTDSHAYIGDYDGIRIIDIKSSSTTATLTGSLKTEGPIADLSLQGNYLYCIGDQSFGLKIIDISNPEAPFIETTLNPEDFAKNTFNLISVSGSYAYITSQKQKKLLIYDISDPASPFLASECDCPSEGLELDLTVINNNVLIADGRGGVVIIDIFDPLKPTLIGNLGNGTLYIDKIAAKGNFAYVGRSVDYSGNFPCTITVIDISDPTQPRKVTTLECSGDRLHNLSINNEYLFAASDKGMIIFSLANRQHPRKLTTIAESYRAYSSYGLKDRVGIVTGESGKFFLFDINDDAISDTTAPATITGLTAQGKGFASINLNWQAACDDEGGSGVTGYRIFRHDYSTKFPYATVNAPKTWFVDPTCAPGTAYTYSIKAFDFSDNSSPASTRETAVTRTLSSDRNEPTAPVGLHYTATTKQVELTWKLSFDADSGIESYELYKTRISANYPDGIRSPKKITTFFTSYTDTKVIAGATYEYQIRAVDYAGNYSPLTTIAVTIPKEALNRQFSYIFPHFCTENGWDSIFAITNTNAQTTKASLQLFAADGEQLLEQQLYKFRPEEDLPAGCQIYNHDRCCRYKIPAETAWIRINSNSRLSLLTTMESENYLDGQKGVAEGSNSLLFPVVEIGENCWTGLALANPTTNPAQVLLKAYNQAGELQAFSEPIILPANGQIAALAGDFFSNITLPADTVTIKTESTAKIVGLEFFSDPFTDMASLTAVPLNSTYDCTAGNYLYTVLNQPAPEQNESTVSLINLSTKPATITLFWQDSSDVTQRSESLTVPGHGKQSFTIANKLGLGSLNIISNQPVSVLQTLNPTPETGGYASAYAFSRGLDEINFTHIRPNILDKNEQHLFTISNLSRLQQNRLTMVLFREGYDSLITIEKTIPAGTTRTFNLRDLIGLFHYQELFLYGRGCWLQVKSELPINGFYTYQSGNQQKMTMISAE